MRLAVGMAALSFMLAAGIGGTALARDKRPNKDGNDDRVGTVWHFRATSGQSVDNGIFRVYKHEIFKGRKKIGQVEPKGAGETTLLFSGSPNYTGRAILRKVQRAPIIWEGEWVRSDGSKWLVKVDVRDK